MKGSEGTTQFRKGTLELCVLALISQRPRYGYDLVTTLGAWPALRTVEGTLYPLLRRLQKDGLLGASWQESVSGPPRKYYHLSTEGTELLAQLSEEWRALNCAVSELLDAEVLPKAEPETPLEVAGSRTPINIK